MIFGDEEPGTLFIWTQSLLRSVKAKWRATEHDDSARRDMILSDGLQRLTSKWETPNCQLLGTTYSTAIATQAQDRR
jgi:hypothetical protein